MFAVSAAPGTALGDQLAATFQLPPAVFVQVSVAAVRGVDPHAMLDSRTIEQSEVMRRDGFIGMRWFRAAPAWQRRAIWEALVRKCHAAANLPPTAAAIASTHQLDAEELLPRQRRLIRQAQVINTILEQGTNELTLGERFAPLSQR